MMYNCSTTPEDLLFTTSKLIHTIPFPLGATLTTTLTYDYDKNCFFTQDENNFLMSESEKRSINTSLLYKNLSNHLFDETFEDVYCWYSNIIGNEGYLDIYTSWMMSLVNISKHSFFPQYENNLHHLSQEIIQNCEKWGIKKYLYIAIDMLKTHFKDLKDFDITIEHDMEIDEEWVALEKTVEGDIEEVYNKYDKYSENLVFSVPWPERDRIRLSLNIE